MSEIKQSTARNYYKLCKSIRAENKRLNAGLNAAMDIIVAQIDEMAHMRELIFEPPNCEVWINEEYFNK